ncbi:hypothetical protein C7387_1551 [Yokenella regensburgei]|uniref:Uncharacterized protein n=1 Tax=Yokenella regensburgei TaxID=158877 RepID=A0ABX9S201_9ENTR|nr:hypothetical protein C7387_1551 [Yokenella regensburgei]VFS14379.1 Uncharacterised protein [Yokenella regensburgei]
MLVTSGDLIRHYHALSHHNKGKILINTRHLNYLNLFILVKTNFYTHT